jgi:hypothetical protein
LAWSTWTFLRQDAVAREEPDRRAAAIARIPATTQLGTREVVSALERRRDNRGSEWIRARLPVRPNGTTGWLERSSLSNLRLVRRALVVDTDRFRARLLRDGQQMWEGTVALGKTGFETPLGDFFVRVRMVPPPSVAHYGEFVFWTSGFMPEDWAPGWGWVGIHGTSRPDLIAQRVSAGCIRLIDGDIRFLRAALPVGAPVVIR